MSQKIFQVGDRAYMSINSKFYFPMDINTIECENYPIYSSDGKVGGLYDLWKRMLTKYGPQSIEDDMNAIEDRNLKHIQDACYLAKLTNVKNVTFMCNDILRNLPGTDCDACPISVGEVNAKSVHVVEGGHAVRVILKRRDLWFKGYGDIDHAMVILTFTDTSDIVRVDFCFSYLSQTSRSYKIKEEALERIANYKEDCYTIETDFDHAAKLIYREFRKRQIMPHLIDCARGITFEMLNQIKATF